MNNSLIQNNKNTLVIGLVILITICSLYFKLSFFNYWSGDYETFLSIWIGTLRYNNGVDAFQTIFYNYTPLYVYFLAFISYFKFDELTDLYAIKAFSVLFEYFAAFLIGKIAAHITKNKMLFYLSFVIIPLIPSVILNSSIMAQCDVIYVSMMLASIYFLICKKNNFLAIIFLGLAFSIKLQSAILLPFFFVYMLRGHIKWYYFLMIPVVYLVTLLPALYFGAPVKGLLNVYFAQSAYSYDLSSFFPNVYYLGAANILGSNKIPGTVFVAVCTLLLGWWFSKKQYTFTPTLWIHLAFFSAIFCPYFLPGMRERYLYCGDLLVVLYVMLYPKNIMTWVSAIGIWFTSFYACALTIENVHYYDTSGFDITFLRLFVPIKWKVVCLIYLAIVLYVFYDLMKNFKATLKAPINSNKIDTFV